MRVEIVVRETVVSDHIILANVPDDVSQKEYQEYLAAAEDYGNVKSDFGAYLGAIHSTGIQVGGWDGALTNQLVEHSFKTMGE